MLAVTNKFGGSLKIPCVSLPKQDESYEQFYIKINELILAPFEVVSSWSFETTEQIDVYCECSFFEKIENPQWEDVEWLPILQYLDSPTMKNVDLTVHQHLFQLFSKMN